MEKTLAFGTAKVEGRNRTIEVRIRLDHKASHRRTIDLKDIEEYDEFAVSGNIGRGRNCISAGQCLDTIKSLIPNNERFDKVYRLWQRWHLNDVKAGTREQNKAVKQINEELGLYSGNDYDAVCKVLEKKGLFYDRGYKYGSDWLVEELPTDILAEINELMK